MLWNCLGRIVPWKRSDKKVNITLSKRQSSPQEHHRGFCCGRVLFIMFWTDLKIYLSSKPVPSVYHTDIITAVENCMAELWGWMNVNMATVNDNKAHSQSSHQNAEDVSWVFTIYISQMFWNVNTIFPTSKYFECWLCGRMARHKTWGHMINFHPKLEYSYFIKFVK